MLDYLGFLPEMTLLVRQTPADMTVLSRTALDDVRGIIDRTVSAKSTQVESQKPTTAAA